MNLQMNVQLAQGYKSQSQIVRILTENWLSENLYCPHCGHPYLHKFQNNKPVADFYCEYCHEEFELKSKRWKIPNIITDGAYRSMLERVQAENNPNFFILSYTGKYTVNDVLLIPKHFFTPAIIMQRSPLSVTAKRAGWIGCNIDISKIPEAGKIYLIKNGQAKKVEQVRQNFKKTLFLRDGSKVSKGWTMDILQCIDKMKGDMFLLDEIYCFEGVLREKYPKNHFIKEKIRQQLQILRDNEIIAFCGNGIYKKQLILSPHVGER